MLGRAALVTGGRIPFRCVQKGFNSLGSGGLFALPLFPAASHAMGVLGVVLVRRLGATWWCVSCAMFGSRSTKR